MNTPYYTKAETDAIEANLRRQYNYGASEYQGYLAIADTPTINGWYWATQIGTYTNAGGLVTVANKINMIEKDGATYKLYTIDVPQLIGGITDWTAKIYTTGEQVTHLGKLWKSNATTATTDVPGTSSKWVDILTAYSPIYELHFLRPTVNKMAKIAEFTFNSTNYTGIGLAISLVNKMTSLQYYFKTLEAGTAQIPKVLRSGIKSDDRSQLLFTSKVVGANTVYSIWCLNYAYLDAFVTITELKRSAIVTENLITSPTYIDFADYAASITYLSGQGETIIVEDTTYTKAEIDVSNVNNNANTMAVISKPILNGVVGKNLYDKSTNTLNNYLKASDGSLIYNTAFQTSNYIKVVPSTLYQITRITYLVYYDINLVFISGFAVGNTTSFITPSNAYYVRFSEANSFMTSGQQLEVGAVKTTFEEYNVTIPSSKISDINTTISTAIDSKGVVIPVVGKNLYNKLTNNLNYFVSGSTGLLVANTDYQTSDYIKVLPSTLYQITSLTFLAYYDINKVFISGFGVANTTSFTTPSNAYYIRFADSNIFMIANKQLEVGAVKTTYEEYSYVFEPKYIPSSTASNITTKTVKRFGTVGVDCDYTGRRGIQDAIDAITDASASKQYIIKASGIFEATQSSHFDKVADGQSSFILLKNYVHLIGTNKDETIISGFLPNNLTTGFAYQNYQTIRHNVNSSRIENVTITGENLRYPLHIDGGRLGCQDYVQSFKSIKIWHKGNTGDALTVWAATTPFGLGMSDGQEITLEDCEIKGKVFGGYVHNNQSFSKPSILKYIRTKINHNEKVLRVQSMGSGVRDKFLLQDCVFDFGSINYDNSPWIPIELINQRADHAEIEVIINHKPIAFDNSGMTGKALRIKSKTTGSGSTVTFDQTSTAFNLIIGNSNESTEIVNRYNRQQIYGYQYKSGGQGLSGFAIGSLDIGQYLVGISSNKYIGALGKRLGDCSTVNKTLTVIVNGTTYNIVFNKNYNGTADTVAPTYSNTTIIAEITAVIGAVADVDEYVVGQDYYPQFNNVYLMTNADTTEVLKGMGVVFTERKTFRKALNSDGYIDGICLDDGRIGDECRIITSGEINSELSGQRFSTLETTATTLNVGLQLGISTTVAGKFDTSASPKVLKAVRTNVLSFIK